MRRAPPARAAIVGALLAGTLLLEVSLGGDGAIPPSPQASPVDPLLRWAPVVPTGSPLSAGPCTNYSNASQRFWYCGMNFTTVSFSTNATSHLTGNLSANLPLWVRVTERQWTGLGECYLSGMIGCPSPFDATVVTLYSWPNPAVTPCEVNLGDLVGSKRHELPSRPGGLDHHDREFLSAPPPRSR